MATDPAFFDVHAAPMRIGSVRLRVRDLDRVASFYTSALGLAVIGSEQGRVILGTGPTSLLELVGDPGLSPSDPRQAGLFHTAFLMPTRADLGRWLSHAVATGVPLQGASDHLVSEAVYLADPEGNGIEIYADRASPGWRDRTGAIRMTTDPLDAQDLLSSATGTAWSGFPDQGMIGHVHLQVGDTVQADRFYTGILGFDIATRYPGASFYGSGGYHHQLAANAWNSRSSGKRRVGMAGLDAVEIVVRDTGTLAAIATRAAAGETAEQMTAPCGAVTLCDPWGTTITLRN